MKPISGNFIALACLLMAVALMVFIFAESRNDPGLRMAALVAGTALVATLGAIASTILTGKDLTHTKEPPAVPPTSGSIGPQPPTT